MKLELSRDARASIRERRIVVIGGGNTALDAARECALLGAKDVTVVYRRSAEAMSAYAHEVNAARLEGVRFVTHAQPICVVRNEDHSVRALRVGTTDANGKPVPNAEYEMACDTIIVAIGQSKIASVAHCFPGVKVDARGLVVCDAHTGETGHPKVFAGGDCVNGGKEVVNAVAEGRNAARALLARWGKP
jgi:glutamate synthase (NADPH/NADH) small chain